MKDNIWISRLLGFGAVLETLVGVGLVLVPSVIVSLLLGESLSGAGRVVARLAGGGLLALGIACWFARSTPFAHANFGVAVGFLVYNIVACITLALVRPLPPGPFLLLGAAALHGVLAVALLQALVSRNRRW